MRIISVDTGEISMDTGKISVDSRKIFMNTEKISVKNKLRYSLRENIRDFFFSFLQESESHNAPINLESKFFWTPASL